MLARNFCPYKDIPCYYSSSFLFINLFPLRAFSLPFRSNLSSLSANNPFLAQPRKRSLHLEPLLKLSAVKQEDGQEFDEIQDGRLVEDADSVEDELEDEEVELYAGDGSGGGGILLAGTWWDKKALDLAEEVSMSLGGHLKIYAFKTSASSTIKVRIENIAEKYGSPRIIDIEDFSSAYRAHLDEAGSAGAVPDNYSLEVSSPGIERVVQVPQDLDRFKDLPMYVKYVSEEALTGLIRELDGVFKLVSFDLESSSCTWSIADVRRNRLKGRPLSKKQREWRLETPFNSLRLVRRFSDC